MLTNLFLALALTLLAAFNYTSLSLARLLTRAREVGIRKASGAVRGQVILQFLTESTLVAILAFGLSLLISSMVAESGLFGADHQQATFDMTLLSGLVLYTLLTGLIAGAVPAWLLLWFQPVQVLRNLQMVKLVKGVGLYKFLIVVQFAVTTMIMIFVVVLRNAGTEANRALVETLPNNVVLLQLKGQAADGLQHQIEQLSQVKRVSVIKSFGSLLLWAGFFGIPAGWFCSTLLRERMGNYVDIGPVNRAFGFLLVGVVALLTVFSQTLRATRINPADVLRGE